MIRQFAILASLALILSACAKDAKAPQNEPNAPVNAKSITISVESCIEMALAPTWSYSVYAPIDKASYIVASGAVYSWDLGSGVVEKIEDSVLILDNICILNIHAGALINIELVQSAPSSPACGGPFQPTCAPPAPPTCPPWICQGN